MDLIADSEAGAMDDVHCTSPLSTLGTRARVLE